jgi:hypothetical protein
MRAVSVVLPIMLPTDERLARIPVTRPSRVGVVVVPLPRNLRTYHGLLVLVPEADVQPPRLHALYRLASGR